MEAKWQKNHQQIMELEEKKSKLLQEIEILQEKRDGFADTLTDINKSIKSNQNSANKRELEKQQAVLNLEKKTALLKKKLEEKQQDLSEQALKFKSVQESLKSLESEIEKQKVVKEEMGVEIEKLFFTLRTFKRENQELASEHLVKITNLKEEAEQLKIDIQAMKEELTIGKESILKETKMLSIMRSDLQIYETRMRKKYPNEVFILTT